MAENKIVNTDKLHALIYTIRGVQVMYDNDLAVLYGVEIKRLNEQVKRNMERFPEEFMFQLTDEEFAFLRSQNATLETGRGRHRKYLPYVFTEQGVTMLSAVLRSKGSFLTDRFLMPINLFLILSGERKKRSSLLIIILTIQFCCCLQKTFPASPTRK